MNDQLDKLESSVARLVQAYNEMKAENAALKAQLADKTAAVEGRSCRRAQPHRFADRLSDGRPADGTAFCLIGTLSGRKSES